MHELRVGCLTGEVSAMLGSAGAPPNLLAGALPLIAARHQRDSCQKSGQRQRFGLIRLPLECHRDIAELQCP